MPEGPVYVYHPLCTTEEFSKLVRYEKTVITRMIRTGKLDAAGRPYRIHVKEAAKFGLDSADLRELLREIRTAGDAAK